MDTAPILNVLRDFHDAAAHADGARYFAHLTPDAVFVGTDATERWSKDQFKAYAEPYFSKGKGWTYTPHDCHIVISADGNTAWFDEQLDNAKYGPCRGSGVLVRAGKPTDADQGWKIAQYVLSVPIPNDLMPKVAEIIRNGH